MYDQLRNVFSVSVLVGSMTLHKFCDSKNLSIKNVVEELIEYLKRLN